MSVLKRNNVNVSGEGKKVLLFAHGLGCDQNAWNHIKGLFTQNYQLVLIDLVGAGKSDLACYNPQKYSSLDGYVNDIIEVCDELKFKKIIQLYIRNNNYNETCF